MANFPAWAYNEHGEVCCMKCGRPIVGELWPPIIYNDNIPFCDRVCAATYIAND